MLSPLIVMVVGDA